MLLSFARIDGSASGSQGLNQVIAFDHRDGRMPVASVQIFDEDRQDLGRVTLMSWRAADGVLETANITGDASLLHAFGGDGFLFAQLNETDGAELDNVQVIKVHGPLPGRMLGDGEQWGSAW